MAVVSITDRSQMFPAIQQVVDAPGIVNHPELARQRDTSTQVLQFEFPATREALFGAADFMGAFGLSELAQEGPLAALSQLGDEATPAAKFVVQIATTPFIQRWGRGNVNRGNVIFQVWELMLHNPAGSPS